MSYFKTIIEKEYDKYLVIKKEDIEEYFSKNFRCIEDSGISYEDIFNSVVESINYMRSKKGKPPNKYIICNQDEVYANKVWDIILEGEKEKL